MMATWVCMSCPPWRQLARRAGTIQVAIRLIIIEWDDSGIACGELEQKRHPADAERSMRSTRWPQAGQLQFVLCRLGEQPLAKQHDLGQLGRRLGTNDPIGI